MQRGGEVRRSGLLAIGVVPFLFHRDSGDDRGVGNDHLSARRCDGHRAIAGDSIGVSIAAASVLRDGVAVSGQAIDGDAVTKGDVGDVQLAISSRNVALLSHLKANAIQCIGNRHDEAECIRLHQAVEGVVLGRSLGDGQAAGFTGVGDLDIFQRVCDVGDGIAIHRRRRLAGDGCVAITDDHRSRIATDALFQHTILNEVAVIIVHVKIVEQVGLAIVIPFSYAGMIFPHSFTVLVLKLQFNLIRGMRDISNVLPHLEHLNRRTGLHQGVGQRALGVVSIILAVNLDNRAVLGVHPVGTTDIIHALRDVGGAALHLGHVRHGNFVGDSVGIGADVDVTRRYYLRLRISITNIRHINNHQILRVLRSRGTGVRLVLAIDPHLVQGQFDQLRRVRHVNLCLLILSHGIGRSKVIRVAVRIAIRTLLGNRVVTHGHTGDGHGIVVHHALNGEGATIEHRRLIRAIDGILNRAYAHVLPGSAGESELKLVIGISSKLVLIGNGLGEHDAAGLHGVGDGQLGLFILRNRHLAIRRRVGRRVARSILGDLVGARGQVGQGDRSADSVAGDADRNNQRAVSIDGVAVLLSPCSQLRRRHIGGGQQHVEGGGAIHDGVAQRLGDGQAAGGAAICEVAFSARFTVEFHLLHNGVRTVTLWHIFHNDEFVIFTVFINQFDAFKGQACAARDKHLGLHLRPNIGIDLVNALGITLCAAGSAIQREGRIGSGARDPTGKPRFLHSDLAALVVVHRDRHIIVTVQHDRQRAIRIGRQHLIIRIVIDDIVSIAADFRDGVGAGGEFGKLARCRSTCIRHGQLYIERSIFIFCRIGNVIILHPSLEILKDRSSGSDLDDKVLAGR